MPKKIILFQPYYDLEGHFKSLLEIYRNTLTNIGFNCYCVLGRSRKNKSIDSDTVYKSIQKNKLLRILSSYLGLRKVGKVAQNNNIGTIHLLDFEIVILGMFLRFNKNLFSEKKIVLTLHSVNYLRGDHSFLKKLYKHLIIWSYQYLDKNFNADIITNGETLTSYFQSQIRFKNTRIITSSWGARKVNISQQRKLIERKKNSFLFLGIIRRDKNLEYLLDQFSTIDNDFTLTIAGMPFEYDIKTLTSLVENSGINSDRIKTYFEFIDNTQYQNLLLSHQYLVLPYSSENKSSSGPLIQALQYELIPIVSNYGERGSIVKKNGIGYTFEFETSSKSLTEIVESISSNNSEDYDFYLDRIRHVKQDFQWENIIKKLIYDSKIY